MTVYLSNPSKIELPEFETSAPHIPGRNRIYRQRGKRALDMVVVATAAPIWVPIVLLLAILVMLRGGKPFFVQERIGHGGRTFRMIKLRTMVLDAEQRLDAYLAENADAAREWAVTQKLQNDPRVTGLGRFLRKTSLDELPQLWNVLIGEMSLVGPRPILLPQRDIYSGTAFENLRPGITGPWQIASRNTCSFAERARYDAVYARNVSLAVDLRILLRTVSVMVRGTGC